MQKSLKSVKCSLPYQVFSLKEDENYAVANSYLFSNLSSCELFWNFCTKKAINKVETTNKRILRFTLNYYVSNYEVVLQKENNCIMEVKRLRVLALEVFRAISGMNQE